MFKRPKPPQWTIIEKEVMDEIIFKTDKPRDRIMLELMARAGMRIGEVLKLTPGDLDDRTLRLQAPKSGRESELVFIHRKLSNRLKDYIKEQGIEVHMRIFTITYVTAWTIVHKAGASVGVKLSPHDLRRHAATYASRSGVPIEIVSKIILRHSDLLTTQRYLGKVSDFEALRWGENLHG